MITFAILILIVAKALPGLNTHISSIHVTRITSIVFLFAGALSLNSLNLESLGSGVGIYSGFFQITSLSQLIEIFLFMIGGGILIAWPQIKYSLSFPVLALLRQELFTQKSQQELTLTPKEGATLTLLLTDKYSIDYSLVVLFSSLGSSLLISSYDLISVYLSIELQSFGLYVLSTLYRDSESSTSAGLKYFLLGGLSSCIILLGTGIIYSYTGTTNLESLYIINSVFDVNQQYNITSFSFGAAEVGCISLGLSLIFIGFLFKIAAAPLHNWSPDVYDGTPTIVTTWLTIIPKIAILFILLELQIKLGSFGLLDDSYNLAGIKTIIINNSGYLLKTLLLISAILSLIIGSLLGLAQIRIKRLLAYSTISHIGFILLALAVNTEQSIDSFIFYIIQYTITNLNIFLVILGLTYCLSTNSSESVRNSRYYDYPVRGACNAQGERLEETANLSTERNHSINGIVDISFISEFKGLFFSNPILSISLVVSLFSMAGIPPLIGFFSKQLVLYSALQNGYYFISVLAIIVSVISCSYYLQIIKLLFTHSLEHIATSPSLIKGEISAPTTTASASASTSEDCYADLEEDNAIISTSEAGRDIHLNKQNEIILTNTHSYLISILTLTILLFFIKPSLILNSTQLLSLSLFYI
jgi:NADH-ubiquinone oxidoreductase chain 2